MELVSILRKKKQVFQPDWANLSWKDKETENIDFSFIMIEPFIDRIIDHTKKKHLTFYSNELNESDNSGKKCSSFSSIYGV